MAEPKRKSKLLDGIKKKIKQQQYPDDEIISASVEYRKCTLDRKLYDRLSPEKKLEYLKHYNTQIQPTVGGKKLKPNSDCGRCLHNLVWGDGYVSDTE